MHKKGLLLVLLAVIAMAAQSQVANSGLAHVVDSILKNAVNNRLIPGAVIQIVQNGRVLYRNAFGFAERNDDKNQPLAHPVKMTTQHSFDLASLTKVVGTTTAIMLLADKKQIDVSDPVGKYLPAFDTGSKRAITITHLLTHTAGLITWYPLFYRARNKQQVYKIIDELPLAYPVGKERHYSDLGFILLGEIIEKVSGLPLEQFTKANIFKPLGMRHTTYLPRAAGLSNFAATSHGNPFETRMVHDASLGHVFSEIHPAQWNEWRSYTLSGEVNDGNAWYAMKGVSGHAGLFSTIEDLQKLIDMLLNKGRVHGTQFISENTIKQFLTQDEFKNGLGWMMNPDELFMYQAPEKSFGHTGFTGTSIAVVPSLKLSVVLLINRQNMGLLPSGYYYNPNPLRKAIFEAALQHCSK